MKKLILLLTFVLCITVCTAGCHNDSNEPTLPVYNNDQVTLPDTSASVPAADTTDDTTQQATTLPIFTTEATTQEQPTEEQPTAPAAAEKYRNQYTAYGEPVVLYEVIGSGENAAYSGNYNRYVYNGAALMTIEKWSMTDSGDRLVSTTDYTYDGRGHLIRTEERIPDTQGNLYTYCLTELVNNNDGDIATKSISYLNADGSTKQQTVYGYTYDDYGRQTLCTVTEDGSFTEQTETEYVYDGSTLSEQTETTTKYPGTPYEQTNVLTLTFDKNGNILTRSEKDNAVNYTTAYEYDGHDREVGSRTTHANGSVTEYTVTKYDDLGGGCSRVTVRRFAEDGSLYSTQITCTDQYGNVYIPEN